MTFKLQSTTASPLPFQKSGIKKKGEIILNMLQTFLHEMNSKLRETLK